VTACGQHSAEIRHPYANFIRWSAECAENGRNNWVWTTLAVKVSLFLTFLAKSMWCFSAQNKGAGAYCLRVQEPCPIVESWDSSEPVRRLSDEHRLASPLWLLIIQTNPLNQFYACIFIFGEQLVGRRPLRHISLEMAFLSKGCHHPKSRSSQGE
jgi:hypothetical protein